MHPILAVLVVAAQASYYEAKVATYGCNSIAEVRELRSLRADASAFQMALLKKQADGQCVAILEGTLIKGTIESADESVLRVNEEIDPPGYEAPLEDFAIKALPKDPS